jgi:CheY-like chemotaxis protein
MERAEDKTILVVDDEPNVRQYLTTILKTPASTLSPQVME